MYDPSLQVFFFSLKSQLFSIFLLGQSDISISEKHIYPFPGPVLINQIWADICYSGTRQTFNSVSKATNKKFRKYLIDLIRRGRSNHILNACIYFASSSPWCEVIGLQIYGCPMTEAQGLRNLPGLKKKSSKIFPERQSKCIKAFLFTMVGWIKIYHWTLSILEVEEYLEMMRKTELNRLTFSKL